MPSVLHEVLVGLFRDRPDLLVELVGGDVDALAAPVVRFERDEPNFSQLTEINADLVLRVFGRHRRPRCALIVEVQLAIDRDKERAWPAYQAGAHRRLGCPAYVVVVTLDTNVAAWAAGPFCTGQTVFAPIVVGPHRVPIVRDDRERASLERILLSGLAHAQHPAVVDIGELLWTTLRDADLPDRDCYWDLFLKAIDQATRETLMLRLDDYEPQSDWGKGIYAKGRIEGEAKGRIEGEAEALAVLLEARGLPMAPVHHDRVAACSDLAQLHVWLRRAATATDLDEVFR